MAAHSGHFFCCIGVIKVKITHVILGELDGH